MQPASSLPSLPVARPPAAAGSCQTAPASITRQHGAGLIELTLVAVPILLAGLGGIELAHWLLTRQAVSLALLEAGRAGITDHARPHTMATAFEQALLPLFTATSRPLARQKQRTAFAQRRQVTGAAPWQIELVSPSPGAFSDFADPALANRQFEQLPAINNHYQFEQDQRRRAQGWPGGLGPESGVSIYRANTLVLRLTYLHEPVVPGMKGLMRLLGQPNGTYGQHAMAHGYLPMRREISLVMQSHPVHWPMPADGTIVRPGVQPMYQAGTTPLPCAGLWCETPPGRLTTPAGPNLPADGLSGWPATVPKPPTAAGQSPPDTGLVVSPDDPSCGVTLCCAAA